MGEEGARTQEGVNELCSGVHHFGTPKSEMCGIAWMVEKRKSSNSDHPGGIIGGEGGGLVGGYGRLNEELDDLRALGVVFGSGLRGHCCQTGQRRLAVS